MTPPIPSIEPTSFVAGDTVKWTKALSDYSPADGWVLSYILRGVTGAPPTVTVTSNTSDYSVVIAAVDTAALAAGTYLWDAFVKKSGERYAVDSGVITVLQNIESGTTAILSEAATNLPLVQAAIKARLTGQATSYSINGRALQYIPLKELYTIRALLMREIRRERNTISAAPSRAVTFCGT